MPGVVLGDLGDGRTPELRDFEHVGHIDRGHFLAAAASSKATRATRRLHLWCTRGVPPARRSFRGPTGVVRRSRDRQAVQRAGNVGPLDDLRFQWRWSTIRATQMQAVDWRSRPAHEARAGPTSGRRSGELVVRCRQPRRAAPHRFRAHCGEVALGSGEPCWRWLPPMSISLN